MCTLALLPDAVILYSTKHETGERIKCQFSCLLDGRKTPERQIRPIIEPRVDFLYLDKDRVWAVYGQLESEFPEKEDTFSLDHSGEVSLGTGDLKLALTRNSRETHSYQRQRSSPERKCIDLLNMASASGKIGYYANATEWRVAEIKRLKGLLDTPNETLVQLAYVLIRIEGHWKGLSKDFDPPRDLVALERQVSAEADRNLDYELSHLQGFVIIDGIFRTVSVSSQNHTFEEMFGFVPKRVAFRFSVAKKAGADLIGDGSRLRVFGTAIHRRQLGSYIEVSPIAVFAP